MALDETADILACEATHGCASGTNLCRQAPDQSAEANSLVRNEGTSMVFTRRFRMVSMTAAALAFATPAFALNPQPLSRADRAGKAREARRENASFATCLIEATQPPGVEIPNAASRDYFRCQTDECDQLRVRRSREASTA